MNREEKEKGIEIAVSEVGEDATKYGEFVSSYFAWIPLQKQKENAEKLEKMTEEEKGKN